MKRLHEVTRIFWAAALALVVSASAWAQEGDFGASLSPYGEWVVTPHFGRVWRPSPVVVGVEFEPYATGGSWVYTDAGWVFESEYPFGWAVYHYGRWYRDPGLGWVWVQGNDWAPAWVDWRSGGGYVGWVPLAPVGIEVVVPAYRPRWAFVESRYLIDRHMWHHRLDERRAEAAYHAAVPVTERRGAWSLGPPVAHISVAAGADIRPIHVAPPPPGVVVQGPRYSGPGRNAPTAAPPPPVTNAPRPGGFGAPPPPVAPPRAGGYVAPPPPVMAPNGNTGIVPPRSGGSVAPPPPVMAPNGNTGIVPPRSGGYGAPPPPVMAPNGNTGIVPPRSGGYGAPPPPVMAPNGNTGVPPPRFPGYGRRRLR